MKGLAVENDQGGMNHEAIRRLVLSRFEDDVLLRQEVETWLDEVVAPGEQVICDCEEVGLCYCSCEKCKSCGKVNATSGESDVKNEEESVEIEVVPGIRIWAKVLKRWGQ